MQFSSCCSYYSQSARQWKCAICRFKLIDKSNWLVFCTWLQCLQLLQRVTYCCSIITTGGYIEDLIKFLIKTRWVSFVFEIIKALANECNMLCQHVGYNMLRLFVHHVGLCCMGLACVASSLKPVKLFAQHIPTFLLFSSDRWTRWLHSYMKWLYSVIKSIVL